MELRDQILEEVAHHAQGVRTNAICERIGKSPQELGDAFEALIAEGRILGFAGLWLSAPAFQSFSDQFLTNLAAFHLAQPNVILADASNKALLGAWLVSAKPLDRMTTKLALENKVYKRGSGVRKLEFRPVLPARTREFLNRAKQILESESVNTLNPHRVAQALHVPVAAAEEILRIGVDAGELIQIGEMVFYTEAQLEHLRATLSDLEPDELSAGLVRDRLGTTRKYAVALLRYFYPRDF